MPPETHEHYDAAGNLTGTTVVRRGSEWTQRAQSRALSLAAHDSRTCPSCGNYDALVPIDKDRRHVTWDEHDGRVAEVVAYRCIYCASADIVKRDFAEKHKDHKPLTGHVAPGDGRLFAAIPLADEE